MSDKFTDTENPFSVAEPDGSDDPASVAYALAVLRAEGNTEAADALLESIGEKPVRESVLLESYDDPEDDELDLREASEHAIGVPYKSASGKTWWVNKDTGGGKIRAVRTTDPDKAEAHAAGRKKKQDELAEKRRARDEAIQAKAKASQVAARAKIEARAGANAVALKVANGESLAPAEIEQFSAHLSKLTIAEIQTIQQALAAKAGGRLKADRIKRVLDWAKGERDDGRGGSRRGTNGSSGSGGPVEGASSGPGTTGADQGGEDAGESPGEPAPDRVPAAIEKVNRDLDRFGKLFLSRGQHEVAGFLARLKDHINTVGVESALESLPQEGGSGDGEGAQYQTHSAGLKDVDTGETYMPRFCAEYLARNGITPVYEPDEDAGRNISSVAATEPHDPYIDGSFTPLDPSFKNKLEEAQHLPGLETSEDVAKINGGPVTHMTPEVIAKLDAKYGAGKWIVKAYGADAYAGYGIFFPQRSAQLHQDAKNAIWASGEHLARHGFSHLRDADGTIVGIKHQGGTEYRFGTPDYESTIHGDVRRAADSAAAAAGSEKGAQLPGGGKEFMAQPAFEAVGVSDAERAAGVTIKYGSEGRTHIVTKGGTATLVPSSTWIKGENLPVVFESDDTRAMAQAALDAINRLPESERQGQIYAPDIIKAKDGFRVVEANPTTEQGGGSGYLEDNPFIIDSYVSHLVGREPAHVRFIRNVLTKKAKS